MCWLLVKNTNNGGKGTTSSDDVNRRMLNEVTIKGRVIHPSLMRNLWKKITHNAYKKNPDLY